MGGGDDCGKRVESIIRTNILLIQLIREILHLSAKKSENFRNLCMVVATMAWLQHPVLKVRASHLALRMPVEEADTCRGTGSIILIKRFELS